MLWQPGLVGGERRVCHRQGSQQSVICLACKHLRPHIVENYQGELMGRPVLFVCLLVVAVAARTEVFPLQAGAPSKFATTLSNGEGYEELM